MNFGELETVSLRDAWPDEARDFTPWLAQNLDRLSKAIGIHLESEGTEVPVEQFAADILARNPADGSRVLIENQLESTDHTHLGQILTYLAGLEAHTVIWVAREFTGAHLSAIRWLNEHTVDPFAFFAVRVRVVRIAKSPLAPLFEVLERPSGWDRQVRARAQEPSERTIQLREFRNSFWLHYAGHYPDDLHLPPDYINSNVWHPAANNQITIVQYLAQGEVGIYLSGPGGSADEHHMQQVRPYQGAVAAALGVREDGLSFQRFDSNDRSNWPAMTDWLHDRLVAYRRIIEETAAAQTAAANGDE